jgi:predicted phosphodiesterase
MDLTTVADDLVVLFDGPTERRYDGLAPGTEYVLEGHRVRTFAPEGELLCRFATVNDVHFGETVCGVLGGFPDGPVFSSLEGEAPYPQTMNRGAVAEMAAIDPAAVVVKGDLTSNGSRAEYQEFLDLYGPAFGPRLHHVRGNHDAYHGETFADAAPFLIDLPGVRLAVIDTTIPRAASGQVTPATAEWLGDAAREADRPVLVFGHHHIWNPDNRTRPETYFGINPDDSERLVDVVAAHSSVLGYFAGHTHRNRVVRTRRAPQVRWVEVACVKDYPGAWAEYRVYEGGILQVFHRIATPDALVWTERTRAMFGGAYHDYAFGQLDDRCFWLPS